MLGEKKKLGKRKDELLRCVFCCACVLDDCSGEDRPEEVAIEEPEGELEYIARGALLMMGEVKQGTRIRWWW